MSSIPIYTPSFNFQTAYGPKLKVVITFPPGFGRTKQSFKAETDINNIMAKYQRTGTLDFVQKNEARYGDVTGLEFQACMETVAKANSMFAELPSSLRARFNNEPGEFLDFVQDDKNREEARELGLLKPVERTAEPVATPLAAPQAASAPRRARKPVEDATTQNRDEGGRFETGHNEE